LRKIKEERNSERVKQVLGDLENVVREGKENVMPYVLEAVRSYATMGEITGVLRKVYGKFKCPTGI
jgi:methylmalonyl-CoA mutase N-terminal domain/subunit